MATCRRPSISFNIRVWSGRGLMTGLVRALGIYCFEGISFDDNDYLEFQGPRKKCMSQMSKWGYPIDDIDEMDDSAACRVLVALYGQTWFQGFKTSDSVSLASPVSLDSAL